MKLGMVLGYSGAASINMDLVKEAESLGYDSIWTSEAWGSDAVSPAAWVLAQTSRIKVGTAIMQMPARTPAMTAMTAMTLQALSGNRFLLGLGPSGPQVIEGWHGVPYGKPLGRFREYVAIIRQILARERPLEHHGEHYQIPYNGAGATGLGKPLKSILYPDPSLKIFTASITPASIRTAAEIADGFFPIFMNPEQAHLFDRDLQAGFGKAGGGKNSTNFEVCPFVPIRVGDDLDACRKPIKDNLALYIGGMGAREKNFYNDYAKRLGYAEEARTIQDLFLTGKKAEASAVVPDRLVDEIALVGTPERIGDRLTAWKRAARDGRVGSILLTGATTEALRVVAEAVA